MARTKDPNSLRFYPLGLRPDGWDYLAKWNVGGNDNPTVALNELVDKASKFFPHGLQPVGGRSAIAPRHRAPKAVNSYMVKHGLTRSEALAVIAKRMVELHPEEFV